MLYLRTCNIMFEGGARWKYKGATINIFSGFDDLSSLIYTFRNITIYYIILKIIYYSCKNTCNIHFFNKDYYPSTLITENLLI